MDVEIEVMNRLFGQTQERLFCMNRVCNTADHSPSNSVNIVAIPISGTTLHTCLDEYLSQHEIERNCPNCECQSATQVTEFINEPTLLILQLNRFNYCETSGTIIKMHNQISVPTMIQLPSGGSFQIRGAIFHFGHTPYSGTPLEISYFPSIKVYIKILVSYNSQQIFRMIGTNKSFLQVYLQVITPQLFTVNIERHIITAMMKT